MKAFYVIGLLVISNIFMTLAWYGHLKMETYPWFSRLSLAVIILLSWGVALFEYCAMIPANKFGFVNNGGPFSLLQLKVLQEVITLSVFTIFILLFFKEEPLKWNHFAGFLCLIAAVCFIFK